MEECLPGENGNARRGSRDVMKEDACEGDRAMPLTQEMYYSKMNYAKTTHKIGILTESLSKGTRKRYRRSRKQWMSFCKGQNQSVWMDSKEE